MWSVRVTNLMIQIPIHSPHAESIPLAISLSLSLSRIFLSQQAGADEECTVRLFEAEPSMGSTQVYNKTQQDPSS